MDILKLPGDRFETVEADPGHTFFESMVRLAAEDMFDLETARHCRLEAAEHLVEMGAAENMGAALQAVVDREGQMREELASGGA